MKKVDLDFAELPRGSEFNYLLEAPAQIANKTNDDVDDTSVIFCVDISGSMDSYVQGGGTTLSLMKAAVNAQVSSAATKSKHRKMGVVAFESGVHVIGDGTQVKQQIYDEQSLFDFDFLLKNGAIEANRCMTKPVGENSRVLQRAVSSLQTIGTTALGPGVLTSLAIAAEGGPGSTVVVCTDGFANEGLGSSCFD